MQNGLTLRPMKPMIQNMIELIIIFTALLLSSCESVEPIQLNHYPVIQSFGVQGSGVRVGRVATLYCKVTDEDLDSLIYIWTAPTGTIWGSGGTVSWKAPNEIARYPIYCRVEDEWGAYAEINFEVQVFPAESFSWEWTIYNSSNTDLPVYSIDYIWSVAIDGLDHTWIGDEIGDLLKFDGTNWSNWKLYNDATELISIDIDGENSVWTTGGPLTKLDGETITRFSRPNEYPPRNAVIDQDDNIWVAISGLSGPSKFDGTDWTDYDLLGLPSAIDLAIDRQGDIWYTADSALVHYDQTDWVIIEGPVPQWNKSIAIDKDNQIWVATKSHELAMYDQSGWTFIPTPFDNSDAFINDLIVDAENNIWCACDGGLAILDARLAKSFGIEAWHTVLTADNSPIPDGYVSSLAFDSRGNLWGGVHAYGASGPGGGGLFMISLSND